MEYADDLLQLAREIANLRPTEAHQPNLRRALSTAYYALFHLLINDAVASCSDPQFRAALARTFDHGRMRQASDKKASKLKEVFKQRPPKGPDYNDAVASCSDPQFRAALARTFDHGRMRQASDKKASKLKEVFKQRPPKGPDYDLNEHLYKVVGTFSQAHHNRNEADYNLVREWQPTEVSLLIEGVAEAIESWKVIRGEQAARDYLISMHPSRETKQPEKTRPDRRTAPDVPKS